MAIKKATTKTTVKKAAPAKKAASVISGPDRNEMRKWEIESALSTLKRADEIRKDVKMMGDVKKLAQEQMSVLKNFSK
jgi:hypothetical protein